LKSKHVRVILVLAAFCITGLILMQVYWVKKSFDLNEMQFNNKVSIALIAVSEQIAKDNKDENAVTLESVQQVTKDYFTVNINDTVNHDYLENLLQLQFSKFGIDADYEYVIYDCFADSIIWKEYINKDNRGFEEGYILTKRRIPLSELPQDSHKFGVFFPSKDRYIISQMQLMIVSTIGILIVVIFFIYVMFIILKQKKLSEIKNDFINNMTHEFKTPISTISISTEALLKDGIEEKPERIRRYAGIIRDENQRLRKQVDKILEIALLDAEKPKLKFVEFDLHEVVESAIDKIKIKAEEQNGKITFHLNAENSLVNADRDHIQNIVFNLLENAIKYSDKAPLIEVSSTNEGKYIVLHVKDNGIGIAKKHQRYIFNKFYRVGTGNVHNVKGFGLGLHYVSKMINVHKGRIELDSEPGVGSCFKISLPVINK